MSNSIQRVLTGAVLIPIVLGIVLFAPQQVFAVAAALLAMLVLREFLDLTEKYGLRPLRYIAFLFAAAIVILPSFPMTGILVLFALAVVMRPSRELSQSLGGAAATVLGVLYIALPFSQLVAMRQQSQRGTYLVLFVLIVVWVGDTAAYYAGRAFGRYKLAPRISPGKTWEGTIASLIASTLAGHFYMHHLFPQIPLSLNLLTPVVVNAAGQIGDIAESALKRGAGVKDSGTILPGHGGLLDRVDALLFAIPVLWYAIYWVLGPYL